MPNGFNPSQGQLGALPTQQGGNSLALVSGGQPPNVLTNLPTGGSPISIASQLIAITLAPFGSIADDLIVYLQAEINGSSFFNVINPATGNPYQWTGVQIKATLGGAAAGVYQLIPIKANRIKFGMVIGASAASASNGVITRVMDA